jgi:ribosome-associated heat shock protein Hsp15
LYESIRIDKWLWAARFFKTRALARDAIAGGKVQLEGHRVKPGRALKSGDRLSISRGEEVFEITVKTVTDRRGPASQAIQMFSEDAASAVRREAAALQRNAEREAGAGISRRPDKRERRQIIDFTRGQD